MKNDFPLPVYSFLDVYGTIFGPGLYAIFGNGTGQADEGITINAAEDTNRVTYGASGECMHALIGVNGGTVSIACLKTSPLNSQLNTGYISQRQSSAIWGVNTITITNVITFDHITCKQVAFTRQPPNSYGKEPTVITWELTAGHIYTSIGAGVAGKALSALESVIGQI